MNSRSLKRLASLSLFLPGMLLFRQVGQAAPLTGATVTASGGGGFWETPNPSPETIPATYQWGLFTGTVPVLYMTVDANGLVTLTASPITCGTGCGGFGLGSATFDFTLNGGPTITSLTPITTDANLGGTFSLLNGKTFVLTETGGGGGVTYDQDFTIAQLNFGSATVPEPMSLALLITGLFGLGMMRRYI